MGLPMKLSNLFITGCDSNTRWQLEWFKQRFYDCMPTAELYVFDFDTFLKQTKGWFKKPGAMFEAAKMAENVCWLDTDCEIRSDISDIWNYCEPNKLAMVEDKPWSTRRGEKWHNSGVVAFKGSSPTILSEWTQACISNPQVGDQEVLHEIVKDGMRRMVHITDLPRSYNTLRIDLIDKTAPKNIKVMHWTGAKGKIQIKEMIQNGE